MAARPRITRRNKADRLICPGATKTEIRCDMAVAPFDAAASEMDRKWGMDRLPELVSIETAEKWGSAMGKLNDAITAGNVEETKLRVGVCVRGLAALDAEAESLGRKPLPPEVWEVEIEGQTIAMVRDVRDWARVEEMRPGVRIHSLREVAAALKWMGDGGYANHLNTLFPKAKNVAVRQAPKSGGAAVLEDKIPFAPEWRV